MKSYKLLTTSFVFLFSIAVQAQVYYPMSFYIVDRLGKPLKDARVSIKELGYQSGVSGSDGKIFFQDVPVGEIHYFVARDGYNGVDGSFNITTISKNNTLRIVLAKKPAHEANMMLISGEVVDENGNDINGARVELRAGRNIQNVTTDESGNFNIDINLDEIEKGVTEFLLEVTKNDCKKEDKFIIPKNNYLYKEVVINCKSNGKNNNSDINWKRKFGEWEFELTGCEKNGNNIICNFIVKTNYRDRNFAIGTNSYNATILYDDFGNEYLLNNAKIGDKQHHTYVEKRLIANISIKGNIIFSNISTQATKISLLDISIWGDDVTENRIQFRNVPIK